MKFTFNIFYFGWFLILLVTEILIGLLLNNWIRAYFGDFLVVIMLYALLKSFLLVQTKKALIYVLLFSYLIEILQYFHFVEVLGLQHISLAKIIIGNYFSWVDILMYSLGIIFISAIEIFRDQLNLISSLKNTSHG
ncbi:MAG: DUF2809 domain-containing protein [Pedobacter sp.]|nr:MAG: DUF2809 domain-containing protein [Pedobacter sp.]